MRNINRISSVLHLKEGLKRMVNKLEPSASLRALRGEADD
jgi:hypothetical protein